MAYQSLYRRYRSRTFGELVGQQHVVTALRNAIVDDRVGHAYLFSGPRGTGKTSTARILAKALNCTDLGDDGEPCCACASCLAFESGTSYDLQELDAASNNGVEAIRDLISKVALGSPGRTKVYILDEVHMLTAGAENALLKTLEEPPPHVVFVLATTEPHKVVSTIRSRTQHYEFELLPADLLETHVRWVADDAGLDVDDAMVDYVLQAGGGSARDTLSALDQVVAAGGVPRDGDVLDDVLQALAVSDAGQLVVAVSEALRAGRDPRVIGETLLARLREAFLASMAAPLDQLSDTQRASAAAVAEQMGPAAITRALEVIGTALIEMRQAPDPRVDLEVALLRLARPDLDTDLAAVVARLERLEQGGMGPASEVAAAAATAPPVGHGEPRPEPEPTPAGGRPADGARAALGARRPGGDSAVQSGAADAPEAAVATGEPTSDAEPSTRSRPTLGATRGRAKGGSPSAASEPVGVTAPVAEPGPGEPQAPTPQREPSPASHPDDPPTSHNAAVRHADEAVISLDALEAGWDEVRAELPGRAKSRFSGGRFISAEGGRVVFGLPNAIHRDRCQECASDVQAALTHHFGAPVSLELVVDGDAVAPATRAPDPATKPARQPAAEEDEVIDLSGLTDAAPDAANGMDLLTEAFPGAEVVEEPEEP